MNLALPAGSCPPAPGEQLPTLEDWLARPSWHLDAACSGLGPDSFFSGAPANVEVARAVCAGCAVRQECHDTAMADADLEGVWAGFTAKERWQMRRRWRSSRVPFSCPLASTAAPSIS
jgi:WhiB family redox-sensing transcriptional regulator